MSENWAENITEDQEKITKVLSGYIADMADLFEILVKDMSNEDALICKKGYVDTILRTLGLEEKEDKC